MNVIFANLVKLCKEKEISIAKLEKEIGLSNATVRNWSVASPTVNKLKLVADYFGVTVDELLADNPKPKQDASDGAEN